MTRPILHCELLLKGRKLEFMIFRRTALVAAVVPLIASGQELLAQLAQNAPQTSVTEPLPFVSPIFGDNMVLQRGKPDMIWGWSKPGDTVHVQIGDHSASGVAGSDHRWQAKIQPPAVGGPYTMKITGHQTVELRNVLVGDVWLCGGQSNMELALRATLNATKARRKQMKQVAMACITPRNREDSRCRNKFGKADRISMKTKINLVLMFALALALIGATLTMGQPAGAGPDVPPPRPKGPCDIYAAAGDPCAAAHSTTRALYASYNGPLYQVLRQSDGKTLDIGVVQPSAGDPGGCLRVIRLMAALMAGANRCPFSCLRQLPDQQLER